MALDGRALHTAAPALLRDLGTTRVLESAERRHLAGLQINTNFYM